MLNEIQRSSQAQFDRQSTRYGKSHILADTADVAALFKHLPSDKAVTEPMAPGSTPGRRALDVATGGGHTALYLAEQGWQVTATDISTAMLDRARELAQSHGVAIETRQHSAEQLPYDDNSFDLVSCRVAAHHFSDPAAFVREVGRVLAPGGLFLLIDGSVEDGQPEAEAWLHAVEKLRDPSHHRFITPGEWRRLCDAGGLKVTFAELQPFLQPDLQWYFETAATSSENRAKVLALVEHVPASARQLFRLSTDGDKITWWWQRLSLLATVEKGTEVRS